MKIALIIGHNKIKKGAFSENLNISEFDFFKKVAYIISKEIKNVVIIEREEVASYTKEMLKVVTKLNVEKFDLAIELHFNAFNKVASGSEVLYHVNSKAGLSFAEDILRLHTERLGLVNRKVKAIERSSQNGSYGILNSKMPYILTESFFGDNIEDCKKVSEEKIANVFIEFLKQYDLESSKNNLEKQVIFLTEEVQKIKEILKA